MKVTVKHSPNFNARPAGVNPRLIVLHCDAASNAAASVSWILNPASQVSYHALIDRNGDVWQFVPDEKRAWHAGKSRWAGVPDCNDYSIGISFSNRNDAIEPYDGRAISSGVALVAATMKKWGIGLDAIVSHEQIAQPMGRKTDPGVLFPWSPFITAVRQALSK